MYKHQRLQPRFQEKRLYTQRAIVGIGIIALMILVLLSRIAYLQITDHQKYAMLSERNQLRLVPIAPTRGLIFDRNGKLLARNVPAFHLAIIPEQVTDLDKTLDELSSLIPIDATQKEALLEKIDESPSHQRQYIKLKLTEEEVSAFAVNQYRFPGVSLQVDLIRDYPYGSLLAHVLGYVSEANKEELSKIDKKRYNGTYQLGKIGLEKFYENQLQGTPGIQQMETDVLGREVRALSTFPAIAGTDLHLSIDIDLQIAITHALADKRGAVIALDPRNGEILAMVSTPSFDPNHFVRGIDPTSYSALRDAPSRPLFNRAIQGQYPPASTIKPIVGLAGVATGKVDVNHKLFDPGFFQLGGQGRHYRDWLKHGHGWTDLEKSIRESCDIYYYTLADKLGIAQLSTWLSRVGLGKATGIDLPGEQKGIVPNSAWKKKALGTVWYPGETIITGIGQGYILATPLQLSVMASYIANRGDAFRPHFNKEAPLSKLPPLKLDNPNHWSTIIEPMRQVIAHPKGTAYRHFAGFTIPAAGKTGTAQVFGIKQNEKYEHDKVEHHLRDHSLFIGFAPVDEPKIAVAVILENQKASAVVARQVIEAYLMEPQPYVESTEILPAS
ncbi:penicillin-binding protein 2 [Candidatus Berkiella aquae]|uniref:Peptidoglycan D,D-transpeptidase MrdA n=1 Tax=Candidatus Berkiella aquae TaxID=295108 RepID=A0A0Q9YYF2_9GAMM|nr:penicillin-binding protein 2 [Candidatus Berkiella aquae]MCS5710578.1 penicillin-binding protein 2 [Candidatus Berkiella aquae]